MVLSGVVMDCMLFDIVILMVFVLRFNFINVLSCGIFEVFLFRLFSII